MKKRGFLLAACTVGVMLSGCGSRETAFSPSESCVYVAKDGALSSALVEQTGGISVDENELKQYLETAVIHFNEEKGAGALAQNQKNAERLPAALKSVKAGKDTVTAIFDYDSFEDLKAFGETNDNEDTSNSLTALEAKPLSEAIADGWFSEGELVKADGSEAGTDTVQNEKSGMAVRSEGGATLMVGGKVLYRSSNTELKDDSTVSLPETGTAYVIFKR